MRRNIARLAIASLMLWHSAVFAWGFDPEIGEIPGTLDNVELHDGAQLDLATLHGSTVLIYVGADWCPPCVERGRPAVLDAYERYRAKGLKVVYVSFDDNSKRTELKQWTDSMGFTLLMPRLEECPPNRCPWGSRTKRLGEFGKWYLLPSAFVIDKDGYLREKFERGQTIESSLSGAIGRLLSD